MSLFNQIVNSTDENLINDILDDNMEDFLYHLVTGKTRNDTVYEPNGQDNEPYDEPKQENKKENIGREYIRLPDARIKKRPNKQRQGTNESINVKNGDTR